MSANPDHPLVRVEAVSKRFGRRRPVQALSSVSFEVQQGEVFGLIGPNGAGKTTLLSCLLGFLKPDEGRITVAGLPPDALAVRRQTGYLPERVGYAPELTGEAFLLLHARLLGLPEPQARERVFELAQRFGLGEGDLKRRLRTYSRGMRQRVGMAQALLGEPAILFLDEPASGMDPQGVMLVREVILQAKARGATVVLNSHQLAEVERVCDRVAFIKAGKLERVEALREPEHTRYLIKTDPQALPAALEALQKLGVEVFPGRDGEVTVRLLKSQIPALAPALVSAGVPVLALQPAPAQLEKLFVEEA
ncbi:MAG: ABC transporter ATP-binding protein [Acidobacteriota bacterium]|nr:putative ABC transporter ATP-binding protein YxlF [bacterium HR09]